jgi:hypothetical protein
MGCKAKNPKYLYVKHFLTLKEMLDLSQKEILYL